MWPVLILFWMAPAAPSGDAVGRLAAAIRFVGTEHGYPVSKKKAHRLAVLFERYGSKWHVNPYLAMSVGCQESGFLSHPSPAKVRRCGTVLEGGRAVSKCWYEEGRELGLMQVMPQFVPAAYAACVPGGRRIRRRRLLDPEVNVCMGVWLLARRRARVLERLSRGRLFQVVGSSARWSSRYRPCSRRQRHFCRRGHMWECRRFWWVASYNWGGAQAGVRSPGAAGGLRGVPLADPGAPAPGPGAVWDRPVPDDLRGGPGVRLSLLGQAVVDRPGLPGARPVQPGGLVPGRGHAQVVVGRQERFDPVPMVRSQ